MTNKEAVKMLKAKRYCMELETSGTEGDCNEQNCDNCPYNYEQGNMGEQIQALDMAIKALEQEPCDDAISRQAAIDKWENTTLRGRTEFDQIIMMMPPVAPRPKMGQWIRVDSKKVRCSECDVIHLIAQYPQSANINYCPNCGTKMEVEEC